MLFSLFRGTDYSLTVLRKSSCNSEFLFFFSDFDYVLEDFEDAVSVLLFIVFKFHPLNTKSKQRFQSTPSQGSKIKDLRVCIGFDSSDYFTYCFVHVEVITDFCFLDTLCNRRAFCSVITLFKHVW